MSQHSIKLSMHYFNTGDLDRAEKTLRTLLQSDSRHAQGWCLLGMVRQARGELDQAIEHYRKAARLDPRYADPHNNIGWACNQLRKPDEAVSSLRKALRLRPDFPEACNNLGNAYLLLKKDEEALAAYREAFRLRPDFVLAINNAALILIPRGKIKEALALLEHAVKVRPDYADAHINLAWAYLCTGDWKRCEMAARQAVQLKPDHPAAHNNLGNALLNLGRAEEAAGHFETAIRLRPDFALAHTNLGLSYLQRNEPGKALPHLEQAVRLQPQSPDALNNLGLAYLLLKWPAEARPVLELAVRLKPAFPEALNNLGWSLLELGQFPRAAQALEEALRQRPNYVEALNMLGWALIELGQHERAVEVLRPALQLRPNFPDALNNLGLAYHKLKRHDEALAAYQEALRLRPDFPVAIGGIAEVYSALGWHEEAIPYHRKAVALDPTPKTHSNLLFNLHYSPNLSPEDVFRDHVEWGRRHGSAPAAPPHANSRDPERRLRIGYVSADLAWHIMGWYLEPVLQAHDRKHVEVFCYANVQRPDAFTRHLQKLSDQWRSIHGVPDDRAADMIRQDQIDILVDLCNHSGGNRLPLFSHRPAPVQATHLGLQFSTGSPAIDYRITDPLCDPPGMAEAYNVERLIRLPEVSLCYQAKVAVEVNELPAALKGHVTFGCFNQPSKITPPVLAAWGQIFRRLPQARLILVQCPSRQAQQRLLGALAEQGIGPERVTMVGRQPRLEYYRLYHRVDLTLDTFPYTGCFTTCDSLWMGVPVVTLAGQGSMARQGVSLLAHVGLHDLIAPTLDEYVSTAVRLAEDRPRLVELRATLRERMNRSTLMNPERFTRQLEEAYRWMWREWCVRA
jgi:protein O-GlcNAc transferase